MTVRPWGLAVDFGTTATAAVAVTGDHVSLLSLDGGGRMSSSVYATGVDGELLVGRQADNEAAYALDRYEPTPKRRINRPSVRLGGRQFPPLELIAAIMTHVLSEAIGQHNGSPPAWLVVTHPVAWPPSQRQVLTDAMQAAAGRLGVSIPEPEFVSEPVAAAQWYSRDTHHDPPQIGQKVAVYDLGGGTFDVAVLERTERGFSVIHSGGIDPLGGYDFDHRLFTYLGNRYIAPEDADLWRGLQRPDASDVEMGERRRQMQTTVQLLKEALSTQTSRQTQMRGARQAVLVTREDLETLIVADVDRTIEELLTTLDECDLTVSDLAWIYRVGGASRIPLVGQKLEALGAPVRAYDDPKLVVALGAAVTPEVTSEVPPPPPPPEPTPPRELPTPPPEPPLPEPDSPLPDPAPVLKKESAAVELGRAAWRVVVSGTVILAFAMGACVVPPHVFTMPITVLWLIAAVSAVVGALLVRIGSLMSTRAGRGYVLIGIVLASVTVAMVVFRILREGVIDTIAVFHIAEAVLGGLAFVGTLFVVVPQFRRIPSRGAVTGLVVAGLLIVAAQAATLGSILAKSGGGVVFFAVDAIALATAAVLVVAGVRAGSRRRRLLADAAPPSTV